MFPSAADWWVSPSFHVKLSRAGESLEQQCSVIHTFIISTRETEFISSPASCLIGPMNEDGSSSAPTVPGLPLEPMALAVV